MNFVTTSEPAVSRACRAAGIRTYEKVVRWVKVGSRRFAERETYVPEVCAAAYPVWQAQFRGKIPWADFLRSTWDVAKEHEAQTPQDQKAM